MLKVGILTSHIPFCRARKTPFEAGSVQVHATMNNKMWAFLCLVFLETHLVMGRGIAVQEKADAAIPITTTSPPEGNTTFLGGTTWCVALPGVSQVDLQNALDWACGLGMADCTAIQGGGPCYDPDTLVSHASYAFNSYYQQNGNSDVACNFGGTATLTKKNPSYGKCNYATSGSVGSSNAAPMGKHNPSFKLWKLAVLILLLYCGR